MCTMDEILGIARKFMYPQVNTKELHDSARSILRDSILPPDVYDIIDIEGSPEQFLTEIKLNLRTDDGTDEFVKDYTTLTKEEV